MALQPEGDHFQNDAQENRDDVEDGVERLFQDLLLVRVLTGGVQMENSPRNQNRHQLQRPENLEGKQRRGRTIENKSTVKTVDQLLDGLMAPQTVPVNQVRLAASQHRVFNLHLPQRDNLPPQ